MDKDLQDIRDDAKAACDVNYHMGTNHQRLFEQSIGNIAAVKALDSDVEGLLKNL